MRELRRLLRWLNSNKQWLFSGIGCAILGGVLTAIWRGHIAPAPYVHKDQLGGRRLGSPSEINATVESLVAGSTKRIQLLIQVLGENPHLPDSLAETIARRISERNRLGIPIKYDPVLVFDSEHPPKGFVKALLARGEVFSRHGVAQFVRPRYLDQKHTLGADILIVDKKHLLIALNTVPDAEGMQVGFLFEGEGEISSEFADWFDQVLMPNTKYISDWLKTQVLPSPTPHS